jgi:hypothetical protein
MPNDLAVQKLKLVCLRLSYQVEEFVLLLATGNNVFPLLNVFNQILKLRSAE